MPREGPCAHLECPTPDESGGQWQNLPPGVDQAQVRAGARCVCKKRGCRRAFNMLPPPKPPGRKRKADDASSTSSGSGVADSWSIYKLYKVVGARCAARTCPPALPIAEPMMCAQVRQLRDHGPDRAEQ